MSIGKSSAPPPEGFWTRAGRVFDACAKTIGIVASVAGLFFSAQALNNSTIALKQSTDAKERADVAAAITAITNPNPRLLDLTGPMRSYLALGQSMADVQLTCGDGSQLIAECKMRKVSGLKTDWFRDGVDFAGATIDAVTFQYPDFGNGTFTDTTFRRVDFYDATFSKCFLGNTTFDQVKFPRGTSFEQCSLHSVRMTNSDLGGVKLPSVEAEAVTRFDWIDVSGSDLCNGTACIGPPLGGRSYFYYFADNPPKDGLFHISPSIRVAACPTAAREDLQELLACFRQIAPVN